MGNSPFKSYTISPTPLVLPSPSSPFSIFPSSPPSSLFLFKKKTLSNLPLASQLSYLIFLRREPQTLAKFKHPSILSIIEPIYEDEKILAYITEKVIGVGLSAAIGLGVGGEAEIEVRVGVDLCCRLAEVIEGLAFLKEGVGMVHLDLCPENIYVGEKGGWKFGGLGFLSAARNERKLGFEWNFHEGMRISPNQEFCAPEVLKDKAHENSDIYNFGKIIMKILENFAPIACKDDKEIENRKILRELAEKMIVIDPDKRMNLDQLKKSEIFFGELIKSVRKLDDLGLLDQNETKLCLEIIHKNYQKLDLHIIKNKILKTIYELIPNEKLGFYALLLAFKILEGPLREQVSGKLVQLIINLSSSKEVSANTLLLLIRNLKKLIEIFPGPDFDSHLLPLLLKIYNCSFPKLQIELILKTDVMIKKVDPALLKEKILPTFLNLLEKNELQEKVLTALKNLIISLDPETVEEMVIPGLEKLIHSKMKSEVYVMVVKIFEDIGNSSKVELISKRIVPVISPILAQPHLTKDDFKIIFQILNNLLAKIETHKMNQNQSLNMEVINLQKNDKEEKKIEEENSENEFDFLKVLNERANFETDFKFEEDTQFNKHSRSLENNEGFNLNNQNISPSNNPFFIDDFKQDKRTSKLETNPFSDFNNGNIELI